MYLTLYYCEIVYSFSSSKFLFGFHYDIYRALFELYILFYLTLLNRMRTVLYRDRLRYTSHTRAGVKNRQIFVIRRFTFNNPNLLIKNCIYLIHLISFIKLQLNEKTGINFKIVSIDVKL